MRKLMLAVLAFACSAVRIGFSARLGEGPGGKAFVESIKVKPFARSIPFVLFSRHHPGGS
jgi:hypothetical protein